MEIYRHNNVPVFVLQDIFPILSLAIATLLALKVHMQRILREVAKIVALLDSMATHRHGNVSKIAQFLITKILIIDFAWKSAPLFTFKRTECVYKFAQKTLMETLPI